MMTDFVNQYPDHGIHPMTFRRSGACTLKVAYSRAYWVERI